MAFFPHVTKGDKFKPIALLENNVRDIVNMYNTPRGIPRRAQAPDVPVYNGSNSEIKAFSPIVLCGCRSDAKKAMPANDLSPAGEEIFAIATCSIFPQRTGTAIIQGITKAQVEITDISHKYAKVSQTGMFVSCAEVTAILFLSSPEKIGIQTVDVNLSQGSSTDASSIRTFIAKVSSGSAETGYYCSLVDLQTGEDLGDGIVFPVQLAYGSTLPPGYILIAHESNTRMIEGD